MTTDILQEGSFPSECDLESHGESLKIQILGILKKPGLTGDSDVQ